MRTDPVEDNGIALAGASPNGAAMEGAIPGDAAAAGLAPIDYQRFYVAAVESSIHAFITVDFDGAITSWSPGAERMFGYSAREMVGGKIDRIVPAEEDKRLAAFRRIEDGSRGETYETVRIAKSGRKVDVVVTISPIKTPSGALIGVCAILSDVTEQRLAEHLFSVVVEACPSGMIVSDQNGMIVLVNSATERLFGYGRGELAGLSIETLIPERLRGRHPAFRTAFGKMPQGGRSSHGRVMPARRADGGEIGVEIGLNPITIAGRQMVLSVVTDVSDRQRIEDMKNEFIATVSHELRTPLTSITGSLGLLLGGAAGPQPAPVARLLSIAHSNSQRLVRLINDMLDIEKIESGQVVFDARKMDIRPLVEQAIDANRGFSEQFGVHVVLDAASASCAVCVDADRIIQVLTNLLSNACKYSPPGGRVEVRIERSKGVVRISVRDHGPGIPENFRARIFGKFAQADGSYARHKGGSGLGLHIVKQIVIQHGGKTGFEAAPGGGTVFHIELPAIADAAALASGTAPAEIQLRAMICSSDLDLSSSLCALVRAGGLTTEVVPTAVTALAHARLAHYSLFVVELPVRDIDGISLIRQFRATADHARTPIVIISDGRQACNPDLRFGDLEIAGWLDKPIDPEELAAILDQAMTRGKRPRILHVEDDLSMQALVFHGLKREFDIVAAGSLAEAHRALQNESFDASLLDLCLPDGGGAELLADLHDRCGKDIPVVVHSGSAVDEQTAARAVAVVVKTPNSIGDLFGALRRVLRDAGAQQPSDREVA